MHSAAARKTPNHEEDSMTVEKNVHYKCNVCGSEVVAVKEGDGTLVCCDQPMEKMTGRMTESLAKQIRDMIGKPGSP